MVTLRDYQEANVKRGVEILSSRRLLLLTMQTRTGKTITSLTIAKERGARRVLFLTKKKALPGIKKDIQACGYDYEVQLLTVDSSHKAVGPFDCVIVDESHCIGAFPAAGPRAQSIRALVGRADVILLSATPTPESYSQIYHQLWVSPFSPFAEWPSFKKWAKDFVNVKQKMISGYRVNDYSDARIKDIEPYLDPIRISFTQVEAGFKQAEIEEIFMPVEMSASTVALVKRLIKARCYRFSDGCEVICDTPAKLVSKVAQVASGTVITEKLVEDDDGRRVERVAKVLDTAKAAAVLKLSREKKIAVYYKYDAEKTMLKSVLPKVTENQAVFQESSDKVFLSQYQSGREGIRLDTADAIVFFNPDHAFLSYEQTRNRIQDIDRETKPVLIWLFSQTGIERKIHKVITGKKKYTSSHFMRDWF